MSSEEIESFRWQERLFYAILITVAQMLYQKIALYRGNLELYIPLIRYLEGKTAFSGDPISATLGVFPSYFFKIIAGLHIPDSFLRPFFGVMYLIFETAIFYSLFLLWEKLGFARKIIILSGVLIAAGYLPSMGASAWWWLFSHQMPALFLIIIAFYFMLEGKWIISSVLIGVSADFHLIFAAPAAAILLIYLAHNRGITKAIYSGVVMLILTTPVLYLIFSAKLTSNAPVELMTKILSVRSQVEIFPSKLGVKWIPFLVFVVVVIYEIRDRWNNVKSWSFPVIITVAIFVILAFVGEILNNLAIMRAQPIRATLFLVLFFLPLMTEYALRSIEKDKFLVFNFFPLIGRHPPVASISILFPLAVRKKSTARFLGVVWFLVGILGFAAVKLGYFPAERVKDLVITDPKIFVRFYALIAVLFVGAFVGALRREFFPVAAILTVGLLRAVVGGPFSVQDPAWVDVQKWAKHNTPPDALFIVPPTTSGFRVYSCRGVAFDWKSGPGVDDSWWNRLQEFCPGCTSEKQVKERFEKMSGEQLVNLAHRVGADYIVLPAGANNLPNSPVYSNGRWEIYKVEGE